MNPRRVIDRHRDLVIALVLLGGAAILPFFFDTGSPFMDDAVTALAYVVMALGLNIVVGFAGLLDLGYVAFFAIGAYTIGWLASGFAFDGIDDWHWDNEIVDLIRWVGWIPIAIWLNRRIDAPPVRASRDPA